MSRCANIVFAGDSMQQLLSAAELAHVTQDRNACRAKDPGPKSIDVAKSDLSAPPPCCEEGVGDDICCSVRADATYSEAHELRVRLKEKITENVCLAFRSWPQAAGSPLSTRHAYKYPLRGPMLQVGGSDPGESKLEMSDDRGSDALRAASLEPNDFSSEAAVPSAAARSRANDITLRSPATRAVTAGWDRCE